MLKLIPEFREQVDRLQAAEPIMSTGKTFMTALDGLVGEVEINWEGQIENVSFPLKPEIAYLREGTKQAVSRSRINSCPAAPRPWVCGFN